MGFENVCNTGLVLGLRFSSAMQQNTTEKADDSMRAKVPGVSFEPNLTLGLITGTQEKVIDQTTNLINKQQCSSAADSGGSSFSNVSVKREREVGSSEEGGGDHKLVSSRVVSDEDVDGDKGRKKLRLTKAQSALLEESFRKQSTLNPKQKQELARELNLRPRQVEVWFQNRRARTKLKQTELDCEYLKKCCETLTEENRRLQKELEELKLAQPLYMQLPASTLTMCPSCERVGTSADNTSKTSISCACGSNPHFYNPFTNSSAAC